MAAEGTIINVLIKLYHYWRKINNLLCFNLFHICCDSFAKII